MNVDLPRLHELTIGESTLCSLCFSQTPLLCLSDLPELAVVSILGASMIKLQKLQLTSNPTFLPAT